MSAQGRDLDFEELLEYVRDARGFDYSGYKRPTLGRRFRKRMDTVGAKTYADYRAYLDGTPDEFGELFNTILINVTGFFRDPQTWDFVAAEVVPRIIEQKDGDRDPVRIWSAGCATGDEAYSIAILLAEELGEERFRDRVKIYATDIDDDALLAARHAAFTAKQLADVSEEFRERYFQRNGSHYVFRNDIRRSVIFGRNDLLQDPPISRVDLLISRNTLMYFNHDAQERILSNFFFALQPRGYLMLGKAEALQRRTGLYQPLDLKRRIFVKNTGLNFEPRVVRPLPAADPRPQPEAEREPDLRDASFEHAPLAQVVVDDGGNVAAINHAARALFALRSTDTGKPLQDLELSYRPVELRSLIHQVHSERRPVTSRDVSWTPSDGHLRHLDVHLAPLFDDGSLSGVVVSFADVTRYRTLHDDLEQARHDLESAYEELQSTVEELETTNEELQSTNEELETTNEELHSTNEELETMNEELQSTNEELEAMNDELRDRTDEAIHANAFLTSVLSSIHQSVVVVDRQLRVSAWSRAAADLWGVREDEVRGENFLNLDIGIPTNQLRDPVRNVLKSAKQDDVVLKGHDRRGHPIDCTVSFAPLVGPDGDVQGVILLMHADRTAE
jgi:two-component system CheB/CheR fusion protein